MKIQRAPMIRGIAAIFWLGFFMAISFMEAPLKFTAPGITVAQGVQIGRIVFGALNKCEWVFLFLIIITCFFDRPEKRVLYLVVSVGLILLAETLWLLPQLDVHATEFIAGRQPESEDIHWIYIIFEIAKVPMLFMVGWQEIAGKVRQRFKMNLNR